MSAGESNSGPGDGNHAAEGVAPTLPTFESKQPAAADPLLNLKVGDYLVTERLGEGGMGLVYAAIQPLIGKAVAIKVLRPEAARDPEQAQRLVTEASVLARLRHRGIVDIFTLGTLDDGRHYLVMELLQGEPLADLIRRRGPLPLREALELFAEMLSALSAAHQAGLIHRDLKPSNLFVVTQPDGSSYLKLLDFGLAKQTQAPSGVTSQQRNVLVGTPEYISPEQARGAGVGPQSDLYSAGVVFFQLLTGRLPFQAPTAIEMVLQHLEARPPIASSLVLGVPPRVDDLIARLLAKDPASRPVTAEATRDEVLALLDEPAMTPSYPSFPATGNAEAFTLRLGTRFELGLSWLTPALRGLRRQRPERTLHLCFGDSPELMRLLRNGELDCAVTSARLRGEWLRQVVLHEEQYALVAARGVEVTPARLEAGRLSVADVHPDLPLFRYLLDAHPPARNWRFASTDVLGTIAAIRLRVLEGDAVAVLPSYFIAEDLRSGALVQLLPGLELQRDHFRLVWRNGHPRHGDLQQLAQALIELPLR